MFEEAKELFMEIETMQAELDKILTLNRAKTAEKRKRLYELENAIRNKSEDKDTII